MQLMFGAPILRRAALNLPPPPRSFCKVHSATIPWELGFRCSDPEVTLFAATEAVASPDDRALNLLFDSLATLGKSPGYLRWTFVHVCRSRLGV